jgi:hypothetical protein
MADHREQGVGVTEAGGWPCQLGARSRHPEPRRRSTPHLVAELLGYSYQVTHRHAEIWSQYDAQSTQNVLMRNDSYSPRCPYCVGVGRVRSWMTAALNAAPLWQDLVAEQL